MDTSQSLDWRGNLQEISGKEEVKPSDRDSSAVSNRSLLADTLSDASKNFSSSDIQAQKNTTQEGDVSFSIRSDIYGKSFVDVDVSVLNLNDGRSHAAVIANIISDKFHNIIAANGQRIRINSDTNAEWRRSPSAQKLLRKTPDIYNDKIHSIANADELLIAAKNWVGEKIEHTRKDDIAEFARGYVNYRVGKNGYSADVLVAIKKDGSALLYDLMNITPKKITDAPRGSNSKTVASRQDASAKSIIPDSAKNVKENSEKHSDRDYSYDALVSKPDISIKLLSEVTERELSLYKLNRNLFAKKMVEIAAAVGNSKNTETATFLHCGDLGQDIQITRNSFKHGAARIDGAYIAVCKSIADVLENSVVVNELQEREKTNGGYVLLGLAENSYSYVIIRSIVDKKTWKLEDYNELYAIRKKSIKKEDVGLKAPALPSKTGYGTSSTISIFNF